MGSTELHCLFERIYKIDRLKPTGCSRFCNLLLCGAQKNQTLYFSIKGTDPFLIGGTLVVTAADEPGGPVHRLNAFDRRIRVGSLGIIIISNTVFLRHILDPVFHRMEAEQCITDLFQADTIGQSHGNCRHNVFKVMKT